MSEPTNETPVLDLLVGMTADSVEASSLDSETLMLVRLAALVAVGAPRCRTWRTSRWAWRKGRRRQDRRRARRGSPIVGTPRVIEASAGIAESLAFEIAVAIADIEDQNEV
ncbi:hypothetical protein NKG05_12390 [Oerskovia sp. M15]